MTLRKNDDDTKTTIFFIKDSNTNSYLHMYTINESTKISAGHDNF